MDCLVINTYAGSLLVAAKAAGLPVRGSYEDSGFGQEIARLNFPEIKHVAREPWPDDDLSNSVVIAHPPCSCFSNQNRHRTFTGEGGPFDRHRAVLKYALPKKPKAVAIESVAGAAKYGLDTYKEIASQYGYNVFFLLVNSVDFGTPQWRPRCWSIFLPKTFDKLKLNFKPNVKTLTEALEGVDIFGEPVDLSLAKDVEKVREKLAVIDIDFDQLMNQEVLGGMRVILEKWTGIKMDWPTFKTYLNDFQADLPYKCDPNGSTPVIMHNSTFMWGNHPLPRKAYHRIMGFPDDWKWTPSANADGRQAKEDGRQPKWRTYLSKGVCPPVATWILNMLKLNVDDATPIGELTHVVANGDLLDLRPSGRETSTDARTPRTSSPRQPKAIGGKTYRILEGTKSDRWAPGRHAFACVKALELLGGTANVGQIVEKIKADDLMVTSMNEVSATKWMLNHLVDREFLEEVVPGQPVDACDMDAEDDVTVAQE